MEVVTTSKRTEEAMTLIYDHYSQKVTSDYDRIVDMIENGGDQLTRRDFIVNLGITEEVLDAFFNLVVRGCEGDDRDRICDRLIGINKDDLARIVKKLKNETISLELKLEELMKQLEEKEEALRILEGHGGAAHKEDSSESAFDAGELRVECDSLRAEIDRLNSEIVNLRALNEEQSASIEQLNTDKYELESRIRELSDEVDLKSQKIYELESSDPGLYGNQNDNPDESYESEYAPADNTALYEELEQLRMERDNLAAELQNASTMDSSYELEEKERRIRDLSNEIAYKDETIERHEATIRSLQSEIDHRDEEIRELKASRGSVTAEDHTMSVTNNGEIELPGMGDEPIVKQKSKAGLYIILGVFFFFLLALISVVIMNSGEAGPVSGTPTPVAVEEKISGDGIGGGVANGAVTQLPPSLPVQPAAMPVQENVPTQLDSLSAAEPTAPSGVIAALNSPYDFRKNAAAFTVTEQGLMIDGQVFKTGDSVNGFPILMIQKSFVRFIDPKNDLEFRVNIGA